MSAQSIYSQHDLLTPLEVVQSNVELFKKLGWTEREIGVLFSMGLLYGRHSSKEKKSLVTLESVYKQVEIYNEYVLRKLVKVPR